MPTIFSLPSRHLLALDTWLYGATEASKAPAKRACPLPAQGAFATARATVRAFEGRSHLSPFLWGARNLSSPLVREAVSFVVLAARVGLIGVSYGLGCLLGAFRRGPVTNNAVAAVASAPAKVKDSEKPATLSPTEKVKTSAGPAASTALPPKVVVPEANHPQGNSRPVLTAVNLERLLSSPTRQLPAEMWQAIADHVDDPGEVDALLFARLGAESRREALNSLLNLSRIPQLVASAGWLRTLPVVAGEGQGETIDLLSFRARVLAVLTERIPAEFLMVLDREAWQCIQPHLKAKEDAFGFDYAVRSVRTCIYFDSLCFPRNELDFGRYTRLEAAVKHGDYLRLTGSVLAPYNDDVTEFTASFLPRGLRTRDMPGYSEPAFCESRPLEDVTFMSFPQSYDYQVRKRRTGRDVAWRGTTYVKERFSSQEKKERGLCFQKNSGRSVVAYHTLATLQAQEEPDVVIF